MPVTELLSAAQNQGLFGPETGPLSSTPAQVRKQVHSPIQTNALRRHMLCQWFEDNGYFKDARKIEICGQNFALFKCSNGHEKYTRMTCHREYCPTCGKDGSQEHKKRTVRALDRLMWAPVMGYWVFTLPDNISQSRPDIEILKILSKKAWGIVSKNFETPGGMIRTHLMGEQQGKFHIHINVLFPITRPDGRGMVSEDTIAKCKDEWTKFVNEVFNLSLKKTVSHYNFATTPGMKAHKIKYVLRPVVDYEQFSSLPDDARKYILSLAGWHNTRWFGKLSNPKYKEFLESMNIDPKARAEKDQNLSKSCPVCGEKYRFTDVIHKDQLPHHQLRYLDNDTLVDLATFSFLKEKEE